MVDFSFCSWLIFEELNCIVRTYNCLCEKLLGFSKMHLPNLFNFSSHASFALSSGNMYSFWRKNSNWSFIFFPPYQLWDWCNMFVFGCPGSEVYTRPCLDFSDFLCNYYKSIYRIVSFSQVQIKDADCHPKLFVSDFFFFFCHPSVNAMNLLHSSSTYIHSIHFLSNLIGQNLALIVNIGSNYSLDKIRIKFQAVTY